LFHWLSESSETLLLLAKSRRAKDLTLISAQFPALKIALKPVLQRFRERVLPFWGTNGVDRIRGGFHERLTLEGQPAMEASKRLMVQCRQLYVFSHAAELGWYPDGGRLATNCVEYILKSFYRRDGESGWIHSVAPDGSVANSSRDCYAHAFVLLGLAWYYKISRDSEILTIVDQTISFLDETSSDCGGYADGLPAPDHIRRQNPHMHLLEAFLALYQITGDPRYLARASELFGVFTTRFFQPKTGTLCEYLTADLRPLPGAQGTISEPGHHYEWVWLLRQFQLASGREVNGFCSKLYEHADRFGWNDQGFVVDELDCWGNKLKPSRRAWPHTEALKANIVEGEAGRQGCDEKAAHCLRQLQTGFLGRPIPAGWVDHWSDSGQPLSQFIPASTLYHIFCAFSETARAVGQEG
jgi:mannose/cellobiose epimerase-like protein (N-acyl-D-glucosamine 2-epimerase family)